MDSAKVLQKSKFILGEVLRDPVGYGVSIFGVLDIWKHDDKYVVDYDADGVTEYKEFEDPNEAVDYFLELRGKYQIGYDYEPLVGEIMGFQPIDDDNEAQGQPAEPCAEPVDPKQFDQYVAGITIPFELKFTDATIIIQGLRLLGPHFITKLQSIMSDSAVTAAHKMESMRFTQAALLTIYNIETQMRYVCRPYATKAKAMMESEQAPADDLQGLVTRFLSD